MSEKRICISDLHVHTNKSFCAPETSTVESYLKVCKEENIEILGFSNHLYSSPPRCINGISYMDFALQTKKEIDGLRDKTDVKMLFGCEAELFWGQKPGLDRKDSDKFDYVLLAQSHIFNYPQMYRDVDLSTPDKVRDLVLAQFHRACDLEYDVPAGICHPLYPLCCPWEQEVVDGFTDSQLRECFSHAVEKNKSIEIHASLYRKGTALDSDGLSPSYLRVLSFAKECGCKFHFGADAHTPSAFVGTHSRLELAAKRLGITEGDLWCLAKK